MSLVLYYVDMQLKSETQTATMQYLVACNGQTGLGAASVISHVTHQSCEWHGVGAASAARVWSLLFFVQISGPGCCM